MGLLGQDDRREVKRILRNAGKPLDHDEIAQRSELDIEETKEAISDLVDRGEITSTLNWKYKIRD